MSELELSETERPDINKTPLTLDVTGAALSWLRERGFKPMATEVPMDGWGIADIAGLAVLTRTEAINLKMIPRRRRNYSWINLPDGEERATAKAANEADHAAFVGAYDAIPSPITMICEVKVTRADYRKDAARKFQKTPLHLNYLATPKGLLKATEYPAGWGILEYADAIKMVQAPVMNRPTAIEAVVWLAWNVAVRIDHEERYARHRKMLKNQRDSRHEMRKRSRVHNIAEALITLARGGTVQKWDGFSEGEVAAMKISMGRLMQASGGQGVKP